MNTQTFFSPDYSVITNRWMIQHNEKRARAYLTAGPDMYDGWVREGIENLFREIAVRRANGERAPLGYRGKATNAEQFLQVMTANKASWLLRFISTGQQGVLKQKWSEILDSVLFNGAPKDEDTLRELQYNNYLFSIVQRCQADGRRGRQFVRVAENTGGCGIPLLNQYAAVPHLRRMGYSVLVCKGLRDCGPYHDNLFYVYFPGHARCSEVKHFTPAFYFEHGFRAHSEYLKPMSLNHVRMRGLMSAIVFWLSPARKRAAEKCFHPDRLQSMGYFDAEESK